MTFQVLEANATGAVSAITNSSGLTLTIPAIVNETIQIAKIRVVQFQGFVAVNSSLSVTNLFGASPMTFAMNLLTIGPNFQEFNFEDDLLEANAPNTVVVFSLPALLGAGASSLFVYFTYRF